MTWCFAVRGNVVGVKYTRLVAAARRLCERYPGAVDGLDTADPIRRAEGALDGSNAAAARAWGRAKRRALGTPHVDLHYSAGNGCWQYGITIRP